MKELIEGHIIIVSNVNSGESGHSSSNFFYLCSHLVFILSHEPYKNYFVSSTVISMNYILDNYLYDASITALSFFVSKSWSYFLYSSLCLSTASMNLLSVVDTPGFSLKVRVLYLNRQVLKVSYLKY